MIRSNEPELIREFCCNGRVVVCVGTLHRVQESPCVRCLTPHPFQYREFRRPRCPNTQTWLESLLLGSTPVVVRTDGTVVRRTLGIWYYACTSVSHGIVRHDRRLVQWMRGRSLWWNHIAQLSRAVTVLLGRCFLSPAVISQSSPLVPLLVPTRRPRVDTLIRPASTHHVECSNPFCKLY